MCFFDLCIFILCLPMGLPEVDVGVPLVDTGLFGVGLAVLGTVGELLCASAKLDPERRATTATAGVNFEMFMDPPILRTIADWRSRERSVKR